MSERPDQPSFASPGPAAPEPTDRTAAGPQGADARAARTPEVSAHPDLAVHASRWGAPGGPSAAERAAARRRARWWVTGVLVAVAVVVAGAAGVSWLLADAHDRAWEPVDAAVAEPTEVNAVQLVLGSCVASAPASSGVSSVEVVPCGSEHHAQVVGRTDATTDAVWPGEDALARTAARACTTDLLGPQAQGTVGDDLALVVWTPSAESWADGDRASLCVATSATPLPGDLLE